VHIVRGRGSGDTVITLKLEVGYLYSQIMIPSELHPLRLSKLHNLPAEKRTRHSKEVKSGDVSMGKGLVSPKPREND